MSITYYSIVEIFFTTSTRMIDTLPRLTALLERAWSKSITCTSRMRDALVAHTGSDRISTSIASEKLFVEKLDGPTLEAEQRSEDPLIVTFDPVVSEN